MKRIKQEQHIEIEEKSQQLKFRMQTEICRITIDVLQSQIKERRMGRPVVQLSCLDKTHAERATLLIPQSKFIGHFRSS